WRPLARCRRWAAPVSSGPRRVCSGRAKGREMLLIYLYLFGLIVGGVLLGSSLLLGGDDGDADGDAHAEAGDHGGHGHGGDLQLDGAASDFLLWRFRSLRFWTFFLAFFGLTGLALEGFGLLESSWLTLAASLGMGIFAGLG